MSQKPGPMHAIIVYDQATGRIVHTLLKATFAGDPAPDWAAMEARALELTARYPSSTADVAMLRVENHQHMAAHKVDPQSRTIVRMEPQRRRSKTSAGDEQN